MSHEHERAAALIDAVGQHFTTLIDASTAAAAIKATLRLSSTIVELISDIHKAEGALDDELHTALDHLNHAVAALTRAAGLLETRIEASSDRTLAQFGSKP